MRKRKTCDLNYNAPFVDQETGPVRYNLGMQSFVKLARKAGAERRIGKRCIYDVQKIDAFLTENDSVEL